MKIDKFMKKDYFYNNVPILNYDIIGGDDFFARPERRVDTNLSKKLLIDIMMKKCGITESDLEDISIVRSKLRNSNIDEILK